MEAGTETARRPPPSCRRWRRRASCGGDPRPRDLQPRPRAGLRVGDDRRQPAPHPLSIGDGELAETADAVVSVPEMFNYWIGPGRIEVAFLGAAQVDRFGNLNSTVIGDYDKPKTRLPGAGGAPEIAFGCGEVVIVAPHNPRTFARRLDFRTTVGFGDGAGSREALGHRGRGPAAVITDLGVLEPVPETKELTLTRLHPGVEVEQVREATGWDLAVVDDPARTDHPTTAELTAPRST